MGMCSWHFSRPSFFTGVHIRCRLRNRGAKYFDRINCKKAAQICKFSPTDFRETCLLRDSTVSLGVKTKLLFDRNKTLPRHVLRSYLNWSWEKVSVAEAGACLHKCFTLRLGFD